MSSDNFPQSSHTMTKMVEGTSHKFLQSSHAVGSCGNKFVLDFSTLGCAKERCLLTQYALKRSE